MSEIVLDGPLTWRQVAAIAEGSDVSLSAAARARIAAARVLVESLVATGVRAYGVNTGVGALCNVVVEPALLRQLSRNIIMSHAVGVGAPLDARAVRAIMGAAINNFAHGYSGVRLALVEQLTALLAAHCIPEVPAAGSVGYLSHMAHIALVALGTGSASMPGGARMDGADALRTAGLQPLVLEAKEGLSFVNGTPCVTGLTALALARIERFLDWADVIAAMTVENLRGQMNAFDAEPLSLRASPSMHWVGARLRAALAGSGILAASAGRRTQDALSLRAIPQVHGAARDAVEQAAIVIDRELASVTDNPVVFGTPELPRCASEANAIGAAIGMTADSLGIAVAEVAAMSERRLDRLVNPLVSGLPAFLAADSGAGSGFMIAQYTAVSLVAGNRRLAAPASLDGGVTSGLQEDHLCHATPAALKLLEIIDNAQIILAIELLAAAQAYELPSSSLDSTGSATRAPFTNQVYRMLRQTVGHYRDDHPLASDIAAGHRLLQGAAPHVPGATDRSEQPISGIRHA